MLATFKDNIWIYKSWWIYGLIRDKRTLYEEALQVSSCWLIIHRLHRRATVKPSCSHRRCHPVINTNRKNCSSFWFYQHVFVGQGVLSCVRTLIMEYREQANIFLNSALMSNMSTSLRVTITLIRVLSSVPAPWNTDTHYTDGAVSEVTAVWISSACWNYNPTVKYVAIMTVTAMNPSFSSILAFCFILTTMSAALWEV